MNLKPHRTRICLWLSIVLICAMCAFNSAQEGSKSIKSEEYVGKRPAETPGGGSAGSSADVSKSTRPVNNPGRQNPGKGKQPRQPVPSFVYVVDKNFPEGPPPRNYEYVRMGVTIWRLSPSECPIADCPAPRTLPDSSKGLVDTATRVDDNLPLQNGERVRLGLESLGQSGYIYIIDREQFADGSLGEAFLIFPTQKIAGGKNWAQPGQQIHLPRANGCFCVKSRNSQKILVADVLTVLVSPTPLLRPDQIGADAIAVPSSLISFLARADTEKTFRGLLNGGSGLAQTAQEQNAGAKGLFDTAPVLTQSDLPPQTFYQSLVRTGEVAAFNFSLRYDAASRKGR